MKIRSERAGARGWALAATAAAMLLTAVAPAGAEKLVFATPSPVSISYAPWSAAFQLGYFKEEGLKVEMVQIEGSGKLIPQVANKSVDIGWPNPDVVVIGAQPGRDPLPVKFFYNHLPRSVWEIVVGARSPIQTVADLKGKKVGIQSFSSGSIPLLQAILHDAGLKEGQDLELIPVGFGGPAFRAIRSDEIQALFLFDIMHEILRGTGFPIRRLPLKPAHADLLGNGFMTHVDNLQAKRQALAGFGRAVTKGSIACWANKEACVRLHWKHYPQQKPTTGDEADNIAKNVAMLEARFPALIPDPMSPKIGAYEAQSWQELADVLLESGKIKTRDIPIATLYTNDLVPAFNDFDRVKLIADVKAMK
ncbi:MAG: ABC transporter substrate-binding protein [Rhodospirillales bacterium]